MAIVNKKTVNDKQADANWTGTRPDPLKVLSQPSNNEKIKQVRKGVKPRRVTWGDVFSHREIVFR